MAYFDYGINLELKNFQTFVNGAKDIDSVLNNVAKVITDTASAFDKIDGNTVKDKAKAITALGKAYASLGPAVSTVNAEAIASINKAMQGGAQAKTIEAKAEALATFAKNAQKLSGIPDLSASATNITTILTAFSGVGGSLSNFKDIDSIAAAISKLVSAFNKVGKVSINPDLGNAITTIVQAFDQFSIATKASAQIDNLVTSFDKLFKAIRTLSTGAEAAKLPAILGAVTTTITTLITTLQGLNKVSVFGGSGDKIIGQITQIATAFRDLGVAIRSYGGTKASGFDNIETNITKSLAAFNTLVAAFKDTTLGQDILKSVQPATEALTALGSAFETLGRRKGFDKFPDTIASINTAITQLNTASLDVLVTKINESLPALRDLADLAKAVAVVNSQAGKSFVQAAKEKEVDTNANSGLISSLQALKVAFQTTITVVGGFINAISKVAGFLTNLVGPASQLAVALLKLPFNFVTAGFRTLVTVIAAPFTILKAVGEQTVKFAHDLHLVEIGLNAIVAPFKLIYSVISTLVNIIITVSASFTKLFGILQLFSGIGSAISGVFNTIGNAFTSLTSGIERVGAAFSKSTAQTSQASSSIEQASEGIKTSGTTAETTATKVERYSQTVDKTGKTASNASSGVGDFGQAINSSSSGVEQAIDKLGRLQVTIAAVQRFTESAKEIIGEISGKFVEAGNAAFDAAAKFEQLQISLNILAAREFNNLNPGQFDTVLEAVPQVKEQVDALLERFELLAITSPFTSEQIASGFQLAQIYGFTSEEAETLTNVLVDANAAIGASGENISSIILPLGQIKQLGKATLVDLKQVSTAARVPIFDLLAKELTDVTGKATKVSDVMELISAGMIDADFAINTVVKSLRKDFTGAAAASTTSLEGIRSTFEDFRANTLRRFATPIIKTILFGKEEGDFGLADILSTDNITKKLEEAQQAGENLAITINRVFQTIVRFAQLGQAALSLIPEPVKKIAANLALLVGVAFAANLAFGVLVEGLFVSITVMGLFINTNTIIIGSIIGLATVIVANYDTIKAAIMSVGEALTQVPRFVTAVGQAFTNLFTHTETSKDSFAGFNTLLQGFGNGLLSIVSSVSNFAQAFGTAFNQLVTTGKASILVFADLPGVLSTVGAEIFKVLNVFSTWGSQIANFPVTIGNVASTVSEIFSGLLGEFVTWGSNIIIAFSEGINNTIGLLSDAIQAIGTMLAFWLEPGSPPKVAPDIDKWGELAALEFVNGFADAFVAGLDNAGQLIQNNFATVIGAIGNGILEPFAAIGRVAVVLVGGTLANALAAVVTIGNGIFEVVSAIAKGIGNQFGIIIITIINVVEALDKPTKAFVTLQNVVQAFADGAKLSIGNFGETLKGVFSGVLSILGGVIAFINGEFLVGFIALGQVSDTIKNQLGEIGVGARDFLTGVQTALQGAEDYFATTLDNVVTYGSNIVQQFANGMLSAVSAVSQALSAIGEEITYWLEPGSPPRLLPDIDMWGTEAANQFVGGFTKADLGVIGDFGDTIEQLLTSMDISGVDTEKIVEQFASGLIQNQQSGSFGESTFQNIAELAGEAAPDVVLLAQKYAQLASEQSRLNEVTNQYNKQLESVKGTLDDINRTEGIEQNTQKVESLTNALNNQLLTQAERTRIQKQIEKLQAETRVKELEAEKNALERNSDSTQEQIDLQKEQLQLAQKFDKKGVQTTNTNDPSSTKTGVDKAAKAQERLNDAILKYKLQATDTAGKIKIMKEELSKVKEGSEEYYEILTEISRLEEQLANERERESKKSKKEGLADQFGSALGQGGGLTSLQEAQTKVTETIQTAKDNITNLQKTVQDKFNLIKQNVENAWTTVKGYLDAWILQNDTVKASLVALGVVFAGIKIISGIQSLGAALALLSNPVVAIGVGIVGVTAALTFFAVKAGGISGIIDKLTDKFNLFKTGFNLGTEGFAYDLDFSSLDSAIVTIGSNIGAGGQAIGNGIVTMFSNLGTYINTGLTTLGGFFVTAWNTFQTNLVATLSNFGILNTQLGQIAVGVVNALFTYFITPMSTAFSDNDTLLGGLTEAFIAFYNGVVQLATDLTNKISTFLSGQNNGKLIENFFANTFLGQNLEANINEAVGNIVPSLEGSFDLSTFVVKVVQDLKALYNTIITSATQIKDAIITPIVDTFNAVQTALSGVIEQNRSAFSEFFSEVASPEFVESLKTIAEVLGRVALAIITVAAAIVDAALIGILRNIGDLVIELGDGFAILRTAIEKFATGDIIGGIITSFEGLAKVFDAIFGNIADALADSIKALLEFIGIDTSGTLGVIIQFFADLVVQIFAFNKIFTVFGFLWQGVISIVARAGTLFTALIGLFTTSGSGLTFWTKTLVKVRVALISALEYLTKVPGAFFAIGNALINLPKEIQNVFSQLSTKAGEALTSLKDTFINKLSSLKEIIIQEGVKFASSFFSGIFAAISPNTLLAGTRIVAGLGLIDLSGIGKTIMNTLGINTPEIVESLKVKATAALNSVFTGITDVAFNIADAIYVTPEEEQKLADNIKGYLPDFDSLFGAGTTDKVALNIADFITIDEAEVKGIKDVLIGVIETLQKFATILPLPAVFTDGLNNIKLLLTGELGLNEAISNAYTNLTNIGLAVAKEFANPFGLIKQAIDGLSQPITLVSEGFGSLYQSISDLLTIDLSGFTAVFAPVTEAFSAIGTQVQNLKDGIGVLNLIPGVNIGGAEVTGQDEVKNKIQSTLDNQTLSVNQKLDIITDDTNLSEQSKKLLDAFMASYKENTNILGVSDFSTINKDLIEQGFTAADISTLAQKFGKEVPAGLAEGMADTDGTLSRETRGLATNLLDEIADELGIQSPSTKARDEIGVPFVQGIAEGLVDYTVITTNLTDIANSMVSTVVGILQTASTQINVAQSLFTLNENAVQITRIALENISNLHTNTFGQISEETIPTFISSTEEQFTDSFENILGLLEDFADEMIATLEDLSSDVIDTIGTMRNKISNMSNSFKTVGRDLGEALMDGIVEGIEDNISKVMGALGVIFGKDGTNSKDIIDLAKNAGIELGKQFTLGMAEGIVAPTVLTAIRDAVAELIKETVKAAEKEAGVESPSTLFRDAIGKNLTAGIGVGMLDGLDGLKDVTRSVVQSIYTLTQNEIGTKFVEGITDGIASQQLALNNSINTLLDNSVVSAKDNLQIRSPSRITKNGIGVPYVDGILSGLEGGRSRLSDVAGSLLDVLPTSKTFKYNIDGQMAEQPVELRYSNLLTALPQLTQDVAIRNGQYQKNLGAATIALGTRNGIMSTHNFEDIRNMVDSRHTSVSTSNTYNYEMTVVANAETAQRVEQNFEALRLKRRI